MNITPVRIYINGNGSISFFGANNSLITNLQNLNGAKQSNGQMIFDGDDKTISFYVYQLTSIESATFSLPYSALDSRFFNPSVYSAKLNSVYQDVAQYVLVNKNGGASFVGGVVAVYPNYASFPATGQEAVIYIDEGTNQAYFWDGAAYQLLVSTGVEQYANFASFPVTGSANVIYIDMSVPEPYVWDGAAYQSLSGGSIVWGDITGTLSDQTDLQAALDAKFNNPTGTSADYLDGTGTPTPFPSLTGYVPYTGATTNVDLGEYEIKAGQLELDQTPTGTAGVAVMRWNDTDGTADLGLKGGNVTLQLGQEMLIRAVNKSGGDLLEANYQAVRLRLVSEGGAAGQRLAVKLALADSDINSATTIGLVTETINNNQEGFITTIGVVREINTTGSLQGETWVDGDILYLSPTVAGQLTNIKPVAPDHLVVVGYVEYAHAIHGKIYVKCDNGYELDELHNVYINAPTTWQVLRYDATAGYWTNSSLSASILPGGIDASKIGAGTVDNTEFGYLDGVTSSIQTQLNSKFTLPSLTSGSVLFSNGTTIAQNNTNLFWDNTNNRLGIGTASPASIIDANGTIRAIGTSAITTGFGIELSYAATIGNIYVFNRGTSAFGVLNLNDKARIFSNGNFAIGTTTDAGYKLDVNGTTRLNGLTSINGAGVANTALAVYGNGNGAGNYLFRMYDASAVERFFLTASGNFRLNGATDTSTTGTDEKWRMVLNFAPTSGTRQHNGIYLTQTINQTGGANGVTRGLLIEPTLTAAADYRAIETTAGNILFGASGTGFYWDNTNNRLGIGTSTFWGTTKALFVDSATEGRLGASNTAKQGVYLGRVSNFSQIFAYDYTAVAALPLALNSFGGNVLIGTTTDAGFKLDVNGTARVSGNTTITGEVYATTFAYGGGFGNTKSFNTQGVNTGTKITFADINTFTGTSGNVTQAFITCSGFNPTSGTATYAGLTIGSTINQTGGANGITRGLYVNPILTAAADFRAIEVASGITVLGASTTAKASLRIPSGTAPTSPVNGDIWFDGTDIKMRIGGVTKTFTLI